MGRVMLAEAGRACTLDVAGRADPGRVTLADIGRATLAEAGRAALAEAGRKLALLSDIPGIG